MSETPSHNPLEPTIDSSRPTEAETIIAPEALGYVLYERVGVGGMGEVYRCGDGALGRDLAIKVIRTELHGDADAEERFLRESRLTGSLQHPGIVPIHQLGRLADGRPYYTMKLIRGRTFADMLRDEPQGPERLPRLLAVVQKVAQAVAYAHSKGVIHRDLKPANVMVGEFGEVQVMDWGLAKELARIETSSPAEAMEIVETVARVEEAVGLSRAGAALGTPNYMPPEQAAGDWDIVDERADVFALGAIMYEVLTGRPPYHGGNRDEVLRRARRGTEAEALGRLQQCGADTVLVQLVRDCLAPERENRPRNAAVVAERLSAYEAAVQERLRQMELQRVAAEVRAAAEKRRLLGWAAAVLIFVLIGAAGLAIGMLLLRAEQQRTQTALDQVTAEQRNTQAALDQVTAEQSKTRAAWKQAHEALNTLTDNVVERLLSKQAKLDKPEKDFLRKVVGLYERFASEHSEEEESRLVAAEGQFRVAKLRTVLGESAKALEGYDAAVSVCAKLADDFPTVPLYRYRLAGCYNNRGLVLADLDRRVEAETAYRKALALYEKLVGDFPSVPQYREELAMCCLNRGGLLTRLGQNQEAEAAYRKTKRLLEKLVDEHPAVPDYRRNLALSHNHLGALLAGLGNGVEAEALYRLALKLSQKLADDYPAVPFYRTELAGTHNNLGNLLRDLHRPTEAEAVFRQSLMLYEKLIGDFPAVPEYRQNTAVTHINLGNLLVDLRKGAEAEEAYRKAQRLLAKLAADFPDVPQYRWHLAGSHNNLAFLLAQRGKVSQAETANRQAIALLEKLVGECPTMPHYRMDLAASYGNFGRLLQKQNQPQAALDWYGKAVSLLETILAQDARIATARQFLRIDYVSRAEALGQLGRHPESAKDWLRAAELDDGRMRPYFRLQHIVALARAGEHRIAVQALEELFSSSAQGANASRSGVLCYDAACVYALSAAAVKHNAKLCEHYAVRAIALLRQAQKAGFFNDPKQIAHMRKDADLDALRQREDFTKFLAEFK